MAETEVETILREIRERVRASSVTSQVPEDHLGNGAGSPSSTLDAGNNAEAMVLLDAYLTTTARAWDRLPPLMSNRSGTISRLELWVKRQIKRATHWFTWEQVNFNAAVHHALLETRQRIAFLKEELDRQILEAKKQADEAKKQAAAHATDVAKRVEIEHELRQKITEQDMELIAQKSETATRLAEVRYELRERIAQLTEEQRTCYKQLALESSEASVLEDRTRRQTIALLDEFQRRLEELEAAKRK